MTLQPVKGRARRDEHTTSCSLPWWHNYEVLPGTQMILVGTQSWLFPDVQSPDKHTSRMRRTATWSGHRQLAPSNHWLGIYLSTEASSVQGSSLLKALA